MRKSFFILSIILLHCWFVFFATSKLLGQGVSYKGTSAANFLKIAMGAQFAGGAESDICSASDAACLYVNPGMISLVPRNSVVFSHSQWLVETNLTYVAFVLPSKWITAGIDITYFGSGDIEETTLLKQEGTGRVVSASDLAIGAAIARNLTDRFSVGVKIKYIREQLAAVSASAFAFDIGSVFTTSFLNDMKIGISLSNFGSSMRFEGNDLLVTQYVPNSPTNKQVPAVLETKSWDMPMIFRVGIATDIVKWNDLRWSASYAINDSRDYPTRHNLGSSLLLKNILTVRGGYRFNYDEQTFSAGAGIAVPASFLGQIHFDYAFTDFGSFSSVHQFTMAVNF